MPVSPEFLDEVLDRLEPVGTVTPRAMFGGQGLFIDGNMFAKISPKNVLSLKGDDATLDSYQRWGMQKSGKMPYYEVTAEQMEDRDLFLEAARLAVRASKDAAAS